MCEAGMQAELAYLGDSMVVNYAHISENRKLVAADPWQTKLSK